ncbi:MAG: hypothetical protein V2A79_06460 [Planctomycetota bacterium]
MTLTDATGTLSAHTSTTVTAELNAFAAGLGEGIYQNAIEFTNTTNHNGDTNREAVLTVGTSELRYNFPLDTNPGWTTQGSWAFGHPTGGGSYNHDPSNGHTGTNVYGYNLSGDYTSSMPVYYLTTTALDCRRLGNVELRFWKWLGVQSSEYDQAKVQVSNNGTIWRTIWQHATLNRSDSTWTQVSYNISAGADNQQTVYLRWAMGPTNASVTYPGWNIDDVEIWAWPPIVGDYDGNRIVDLDDFAYFGDCMTGPDNGPPADNRCEAFFFDADNDVDLADFAAFMLTQP